MTPSVSSDYGDPPARVAYDYTWRGFIVRGHFGGRDVSDTRCLSLSFWRPNGKLTEAEIADILAVNAAGSSWVVVPGGWIRGDRQALAVGGESVTVFTPDYYRKNPPDFFRKVLESFRTYPNAIK